MADNSLDLKTRLEALSGPGTDSEDWRTISKPLIKSLCSDKYRSSPQEYVAAYTAVYDILSPSSDKNLRMLIGEIWSNLLELLQIYVVFVSQQTANKHLTKTISSSISPEQYISLQKYKTRYDRTEKLAEHILHHITQGIICRDEDEYDRRFSGPLPRPHVIFETVWQNEHDYT